MEKIKDFSDYDSFITDEDYTTSAQAQEFFRNQNVCLTDVVASYWQPETNYTFGDIIYSANLGKGLQAVCTRTGKTSNTEQSYGVVGTSVVDGTVIWLVQHKDSVKNGLDVGDSRARTNKPTYGL